MAMRMVLRLVALLTLILGLLMIFNMYVLGSDVTRYIHALLGITTIVLMEVVLAATRRRL